jgi:acyl-CoA synthetase (AMP-forming)/AMP-acid ligase II
MSDFLSQAPSSFTQACREAWTSDEQRLSTAIVSGPVSLTYAELMERVSGFAGTLKAAGLARGDRVAIAMERSIDAVVAVFGTIFAGGCPCPLEPRLASHEIHRRLRAVGVAAVVFDEANAENVATIDLPDCARIAFAWDRSAASFDPDIGVDDAALLLFTSGSTGNPKGVLLSHGNLLTNARGVIAHTGLTAVDRLLHVMPIYHTNGLNNQLFSPFLVGATVCFAARFSARDMPALMAQYRPTIMTGVPTMYLRMLDEEFAPESLEELRFARCGSAPITEELHRRVEDKLGCPLVVSYGLSEATCTNLMNPPARRKIGTVGTVLRGQTVKIMRPRANHEMASGQDGEIVIAGPALMTGYLGADPEADRAIIDGWLRTGDLGHFDEEGYLTITGRIKDVIIRGGENLSPGMIEGVIVEIDGVRACCVVGRKDADLGEVPVAFVVRAGDALLTEDDVLKAVAERLPRSCRPARVVFLDSLPETAIGKIDRKQVAALAERSV